MDRKFKKNFWGAKKRIYGEYLTSIIHIFGLYYLKYIWFILPEIKNTV
jgi:hypothetical protein